MNQVLTDDIESKIKVVGEARDNVAVCPKCDGSKQSQVPEFDKKGWPCGFCNGRGTVPIEASRAYWTDYPKRIARLKEAREKDDPGIALGLKEKEKVELPPEPVEHPDSGHEPVQTGNPPPGPHLPTFPGGEPEIKKGKRLSMPSGMRDSIERQRKLGILREGKTMQISLVEIAWILIGFGVWSILCVGFGAWVMHRKSTQQSPMPNPIASMMDVAKQADEYFAQEDAADEESEPSRGKPVSSL